MATAVAEPQAKVTRYQFLKDEKVELSASVDALQTVLDEGGLDEPQLKEMQSEFATAVDSLAINATALAPHEKAELLRQGAKAAYQKTLNQPTSVVTIPSSVPSGSPEPTDIYTSPLNKVRIPIVAAAPQRMSGFPNNAEGRRDAFAFGNWLLAKSTGGRTMEGGPSSRQMVKSNELCLNWGLYGDPSMAGQQEGVDAEGGFTVPKPLESRLIDLVEQFGVFRANASMNSMTSNTLDIPKKTVGITATYQSEGTTPSDTGVTFDQVNLVVDKLMANIPVTSEFAETSIINWADTIMRSIAVQFAAKEDAAGFNGDGGVTFGGITGLQTSLLASATVTAAAAQITWETITQATLITMTGKLTGYAGLTPKWYVNRSGAHRLMNRLAVEGGGNTTQTISNDRPQGSYLGYPIVESQALEVEAVASSDGIVYFGDMFLGTEMGVLRDITISMSDQVLHQSDRLNIRGTERYNIQNHETGTSTASDLAGAWVKLVLPAS